MIDKLRFDLAKQTVEDLSAGYNIGTYMERTCHRMLKICYEPDIAFHEVPYKGYIADILNDQGITEIQTVGFRALHDKLAVFLQDNSVCVVHPVFHKKRICWIDPASGEVNTGSYRTYPKTVYKILSELLAIVDYFGMPNLSVENVYLAVSEHKLLDGYGKERKKRATKSDTVPDEFIGVDILRDADDIRKLLPFSVGEEFTSEVFSKRTGLRRMPLWRALKFLTIIEVIAKVGKKGNSIIYRICDNSRED